MQCTDSFSRILRYSRCILPPSASRGRSRLLGTVLNWTSCARPPRASPSAKMLLLPLQTMEAITMVSTTLFAFSLSLVHFPCLTRRHSLLLNALASKFTLLPLPFLLPLSNGRKANVPQEHVARQRATRCSTVPKRGTALLPRTYRQVRRLTGPPELSL